MKTMVTAKTRAGTLTFYWRFNMTEETNQVIKVSEMIRTTAENQAGFLEQIANHIDKLEEGIAGLQQRIAELESKQNVN